MIGVEQNQELYFAAFAELEKRARALPAWLGSLRQRAMDSFGELGFPTTRDEEWKYTNVAPITRTPLRPAEPRELSDREIARAWEQFRGLSGSRLVFVNGFYNEQLSAVGRLPKGAVVGRLSEALRTEGELVERHLGRHADFRRHAFVALNTAFAEEGAFVHIPGGQVLEEPIYVLFFSAAGGRPAVAHPRNLMVFGNDCQAAVVEAYFTLEDSGEAYFTNAVSEVVAGENAVIEHYKLQQEAERAFHVGSVHVYQQRSSNVVSHSVALGGALVRNDASVVLDAEGAESTLNGLYVALGGQHIDNRTQIDHAKPHCNSRELYKGILGGRASGVFNGGIIVRKDAQKTDAKQSNKNLLLSEDAVINTKPQLQIHADDVRCTHGATIGQIDEDAIFYLRSRGIDREAARNLLTYAFTNDLLSRMKVDAVRERMEAALFARLSEQQLAAGQ